MRLINGIKKDRKPTMQIYYDAILRLAGQYEDRELLENKDLLKKYLFLAVKYMVLRRRDPDTMEKKPFEYFMQMMFVLTDYMALLTPLEFMQLFPVNKRYDGKRYEMKDYFTTMEALKEYQVDQSIGERISEFLFDYDNQDIMEFEVCKMVCISRMRQLEGQLGLMEQFFADQGKQLTPYYKDGDYLINGDTGEVVTVSKPKKRRPKYLSVVGN